MDSASWLGLLLQLAVASPVWIVLVVGIVLAAGRRREAPARYGLMLAALVLFLVLGVGSALVGALLPWTVVRQALPAAQVGAIYAVIGVVNTLLHAVAWVLLLVAVFRRPTVQRPGQGNVVSPQPRDGG
ncbi:hypothetical protein [Deinococcus planocerae]|uniref:hypothetical protein n=1 Tax=Deinococcus planocerae TaxID=1737569 RepID=UPI000C7F1BBD|nr:hypothetical protein [Deinococcus planocerae]